MQSTIGEVLGRRGLILQHRRRMRGTKATTQPFAAVTGPNATWCVDFKGHFCTQDGSKCYPLTIIDAYSRFLIRCEVVDNPDGREVQRVFDSAFQEFGLPAASVPTMGRRLLPTAQEVSPSFPSGGFGSAFVWSASRRANRNRTVVRNVSTGR